MAVIEVGPGGRLDCTNIISPELSIITNISFDHTQFLGNTLAKIAGEKAGIIKPHIPVVIGEDVAETRPVFESKAQQLQAPITFAQTILLSAALNSAPKVVSTSTVPTMAVCTASSVAAIRKRTLTPSSQPYGR